MQTTTSGYMHHHPTPALRISFSVVPNAPTGTVTIVFTDIQGSTALWERFGEAFGSALQLHHDTVRAQIVAHGGYEVKTEGDAFMVGFKKPASAIRFCTATQLALHNAPWPQSLLEDPSPIAAFLSTVDGSHRGVRVRMGIHTGRPAATKGLESGRTDYVGRMVNKAARIARAGHGGQILASTRTWELAKTALGEASVEIRDLGEHALRGIPGRERIHQILPTALAHRRFPPIKTLRIRQTNLLPPSDRFLGRDDEMSTLEEHLRTGTRLLTLVGPAGVGKRRLGSELGRLQLDAFSGGVWAADLSEAQDLGQVCASVAAALEMTLTQPDPVAQIGNALLGRGPVLLVLTDLHSASFLVTQAIGTWLTRAPDARILVTSTTPLLHTDEQILPLDPLQPAPAAALLKARAGDAELDSALLAGTVEGLPLAIELVGALVRDRDGVDVARDLVTLPQLPGLPPLASALRRAIEVAMRALPPEEARALCRLSLFSGGFSTRAAAEMGAKQALQTLIDRRLLRAAAADRWTMSPAISEFAAARLAVDRDQLLAAEAAHGAWAADLCIRAVTSQDRRILVQERDNLLQANVRATDRADSAIAGATGIGLMTALHWLGPPAAALPVADRTLAITGLSPRMQADLLRLRSLSHHFLGHLDEAATGLAEAEELARTIDDPAVAAEVYLERGRQQDDQGLVELALDAFQSSLDAFHAAEDPAGEGRTIAAMGNLAAKRGELEHAGRLYLAALSQHRRVGDSSAEGAALSNLAILTTIAGRTAEARELFRDALAIHRAQGDRRGEAVVLGNLGDLYLQTGELSLAMMHLNSALSTAREIGDLHIQGCFLGSLAEERARAGRLPQARSLMARAERLLREVGDTYELIKLICRRGHVELMGSYPKRARICLDQAQAHVDELSLGPETKPHQAIEELRARLLALGF